MTPAPAVPNRELRSTPEPVRRAVMVQRWTDLAFLHWRYDPSTVQALLPPGVRVDTHDGDAWVGLIPFRMEGLGLPGLAPLPLVGAFPEINVRTYVTVGGRPGVWFFSLDVDRLLPTWVARRAYHLPYCAGDAEHRRTGDLLAAATRRHWPAEPSATTDMIVELGTDIVDDSLTSFLTDRWRLFSLTGRGGLREAPVDHPPWEIRRAELVALDDGLVEAAGLPHPVGAPLAFWSHGVDVRVGRPRRVTVPT